MKINWLHKKSNTKCILFMGGWSCDNLPFQHLKSVEFDVLMCYDYRDILIPKDVERLFENYEEVTLISWSLGVYVSNLIFLNKKMLFKNAIAINGTLSPIDNLKGISPAVFQGTIDGFNRRNLEKFWMRMCSSKENYEKFKVNAPIRELNEQLDELKELQLIIQNHFVEWNIFNYMLIGSQDLIYLPENQVNAWGKEENVIIKELPHYCFNEWVSWEEIIEDISCGKSES